MKFIVLNGPNLNLLEDRNPDHYGVLTLETIKADLEAEFTEDIFEFFQSNSEGPLIDKIQSANKNYDGLLINPGGYSHTSVAIRDALELVKIPKIEVHLSNLSGRDQFRQVSITASVCDGYLSGFKQFGYSAAVYLIKKIKSHKK